MIGSSENRISYNGNGIATEFAYTFKILEKSDIKVLHVAIDGTEELLTTDYYVDMEKSVVLYPGYAPGAEIPEQNRPPILPVGERLVIYREVPITQESALDKHWPFNVIEAGLDKLTIICQQLFDRLQRSFYVSESTSTNFDTKVPIEAGKTFRVKDDGTGFEVTEDPGKVIDGATALLKQTTEQAESANEAATNAQNAANVSKHYADIATASVPYVTPQMFGAKGDGVTDDTVAIQNMFEYVHNNWVNEIVPNFVNEQEPTGLKCIFPSGKYNFTNIDIKGYNTQIEGTGVLMGTLTFGDDEIKWYDFNIRDVIFKGENSGIILKNVRRATISDCKFFDCRYAIYLPNQNHTYAQATYQIIVENCRANKIYNFVYCNDSNYGCVADVTVKGNYILFNHDITMDDGFVCHFKALDGIKFVDNYVFEGNKTLLLEKTPEAIISNNHFFESGDTVIDISRFQNLIVSNNLFAYPCEAALSPAIICHDGDTASNKYNAFTISNNVFLQPSSFAIKLNSVGCGVINGNEFVACGTNPRATIDVTATNAIVVENVSNDILINSNNHCATNLNLIEPITINSTQYSTSTPFVIPCYADKINVSGSNTFELKAPSHSFNSKTLEIQVYNTIDIIDNEGVKRLRQGVYTLHLSTGYCVIDANINEGYATVYSSNISVENPYVIPQNVNSFGVSGTNTPFAIKAAYSRTAPSRLVTFILYGTTNVTDAIGVKTLNAGTHLCAVTGTDCYIIF